ncbi:MAG: Ni/Fe hydrogenase subunit alpha [Actinomycetia bacterium]|nr:Ni/Fe hydrogenase subunit alpha [Actinomycetes bacterium]
MTHKAGAGRLSTDALARVEGEGGMHVEIVDGEVADVQLRIYEPPRFYEGFLRGRAHTEPPDITARICGICPVAYQMSACLAVEDACGVIIPPAIAELRRLLYCGEWIESHVLHIHLLHAPDFFGVDSAIELAALDRPAVERGLELKKIGNEVLELIGGRAIHPVNVQVGGFYRPPAPAELRAFRPRIDRALELAVAVVEWVADFEFPDLETGHELVAVTDGDHYPVFGDRIVSDHGLDIEVAELFDHIEEYQVAHSSAKHARFLSRGNYLVGPLARFALARDRLGPAAAAAADEAGLESVCRNPFRSIVVRAVEVVHACEEALRIIDGYAPPEPASVPVPARPGVGHGATEAPRGLLYHRYSLDERGIIVDAEIVPPTSQNQPTIEHDLFHFVQDNLGLGEEDLRRAAEVTIRNHDPCISCATHFLDLTVERRGRGEGDQ